MVAVGGSWVVVVVVVVVGVSSSSGVRTIPSSMPGEGSLRVLSPVGCCCGGGGGVAG